MKWRRYGMRAWAAAVVLASGSVSGQTKSPIRLEVPTVLNWTAPIAGDDGRTVALVSGAKATPSLSGQFEVTQFRLETYRYGPDRITELVVESPLGRFGPQGAGSGERLTLKGADDRFSITGVGWSWSRGSGLLVVSNAVETTLRRGVGETNRPPIEVRAGRFEYNLRTGDARYVGGCVAEDPGRARVTAGELRSRLSPTQTQPGAIRGTNGVVIELLRPGKPGRAAGGGATYTAGTQGGGERIEVNGEPTWQFGPGEGAADQLILLPGQDAYTARGHARLRLTAPDRLRRAGGAPGAGTPETPEPGSREGIEIEGERIEANSTNVVLTGPLIARQGDRLEVRAARLVATLGPDPKTGETSVLSAKATGDASARVGSGDQAIELRGGSMTYAWGEPSRIEVEDRPTWWGRGHSGAADRFTIQPEGPSFEALENVRVFWEAASRGTNAAPVALTAVSMNVNGNRAAFRGGVKATGGVWELGAAEVDLVLGTNRTVRGIDARREVRFLYEMLPMRPATNSYSRALLRGFGDGQAAEMRRWEITAEELRTRMEGGAGEVSGLEATGGVVVSHPSVKARGGRLTYSAVDGLLRLTDDAEVRALNGLEIVGWPTTVLTWDPRRVRFGVEGAVRRQVMPAGSFREQASSDRLMRP